MKKTLLSIACLAAISFSVCAQDAASNLIVKGDFQNLSSVVTTADNQLQRVANLYDTKTQASNPSATIEDVVKGEWYKKAGATGALICKVKENVQLADGSYGNAVQLKQSSGANNQNQNCLTTHLNLEQEKEYAFSFDFKPATDLASYNGLVYVYVRALTTTNALGKSGIGTAVAADAFVEKEHGWYHFSRKFSSAGFETENALVYLSVNGTNLLYDYMISNVSLTPATTTALDAVEQTNYLVSVNGKNIQIEASQANVQIMDMTGRQLQGASVRGNASFAMPLEGLYLVAVQANGRQYTHKVLVK